ncbi:hypothetical protein Tco_0894798 [Tanacetum coccineum]|uniref:Uncharacterized protein n=1 Tax=Tanacetum coccineum TaxID=301880 RepID=A0ABQ5CCQ8_9ASTR
MGCCLTSWFSKNHPKSTALAVVSNNSNTITPDSCESDDDEDDGASRASTPSPTTYLNSLKPLDYQAYEVPTSSKQNDDLLFERQTKLVNQTQ